MSEYLKQPKNAYTQPKPKSYNSQKTRAAQLKELEYNLQKKPMQKFAKEESASAKALEDKEESYSQKTQSGGILFKDTEALKLLKLGLSSEEAKYVNVESSGYLNVGLLKEGNQILNTGGNYKLLLEISQSPKTVEIIVAYEQEGINGLNQKVSGEDIPFQFRELANDARDMWIIYGGADNFTGTLQYGQTELNFDDFQKQMNLQDKYSPNGGVGKTSAPYGTDPNTEFDKRLAENIDPKNKIFSTNENYQIYINKYLLDRPETIGIAVVTLAHELYGHLYAMFNGSSSSHGPVRKKSDKATEWNYNEELENRIIESTTEAEENYNNRNL